MDFAYNLWRKRSHSDVCVEVGTWRKSSYSFNGADCVEVGASRKNRRSTTNCTCTEPAPGTHMIAVRDSKNPERANLTFSQREWAAFAGKIKNGPLS